MQKYNSILIYASLWLKYFRRFHGIALKTQGQKKWSTAVLQTIFVNLISNTMKNISANIRRFLEIPNKRIKKDRYITYFKPLLQQYISFNISSCETFYLFENESTFCWFYRNLFIFLLDIFLTLPWCFSSWKIISHIK